MVVTNRNYPKNKQTLEAYKQFATQEARRSVVGLGVCRYGVGGGGGGGGGGGAGGGQFLVDAENGLMP
ncbi:hypothetical protein L7G72_21065, partial [Xenorhabdus bovienii]|uniref:hypothetical protein n=1 Tax=Xenorhabdus bovienii TaxID=40576 RepID=UPI001EE01671